MPLFDGFSREGDVIQQDAKLKQSLVSLTDAEETTLFELTKALFSIENTDEFVQSQQLSFTQATEGHRLAQAGYREGVNTQVEVIDAETAMTKSKSLYYQAIYSHTIAKLDLQKAMGVLSPRLQVNAVTQSDNKVQDANAGPELKPAKLRSSDNYNDFLQALHGSNVPFDSNQVVNGKRDY
jgi:outer membrane protein TolC